jgi:hypothetical protein
MSIENPLHKHSENARMSFYKWDLLEFATITVYLIYDIEMRVLHKPRRQQQASSIIHTPRYVNR